MKPDKKIIGLIAGVLVFFIIRFLPLNGISAEGQMCLALTLSTVVLWAAQVAQSGFISGIYLALLCILHVAEPSVVFSSWTGSTMWLVIGAYLIAGAVRSSGLGERLSYLFLLKFVRDWKSIILSIFLLTFVLSLLIPNPWPRAFLIMAVMRVVIRAAQIPKEDAVKIGFTVFASSVPLSLIFLTGDASISPLAAAYVPEGMSFVRWLLVMGVPAVLLSVFFFLLIMVLFKPTKEVTIDLDAIRAEQAALGKMKQSEIRSLVWVIIAVLLWMTNGVTGLDIGWITLLIGMLMSLPLVGEILTPADWSLVPVNVLVFLTAAIAIGRVGGATGMNAWIAETVLPASMPSNIFVSALLISLLSIVIHMVMGSVIAVMGIAIPAFLTLAETMQVPEVVIVGIVYLSVAGHFILPFHHLNMLVGQGEENGMYTQKETIRFGVPLIAAILVTVLFAVFWWKLTGVL